MKFHLVFLLALIGSSQAQGLPGVICGITGLLCPPTTVAPTTTTTTAATTTTDSDTIEVCFNITGNNVNLVIDSTQLGQTEVDQINQLLGNSLVDVLGSLGDNINGTLTTLVDGLAGILTPATTPAPTGDGQICVVIHDSDVNQLKKFLEETISELFAPLDCIEREVQDFQQMVIKHRNNLNRVLAEFAVCDKGVCLLNLPTELGEAIGKLLADFLGLPNRVRWVFDLCFGRN